VEDIDTPSADQAKTDTVYFDHAVSDVGKFITDRWRVTPPKLIISVVDDRYYSYDDLNHSLTKSILSELVKAVEAEGALSSSPLVRRHCHRRGAQVHGAHRAASHIPALYLPSRSRYSFTDPERMEG